MSEQAQQPNTGGEDNRQFKRVVISALREMNSKTSEVISLATSDYFDAKRAMSVLKFVQETTHTIVNFLEK